MKRAGLAATTALVTVAATVQVAYADPGPSAAPSPRVAASRALAAAATRGAEVKADPGTSFAVTDVIVDRDGSTHTRMARTFRKLPVLGGDVVVHQTRTGGWKGSSLGLAKAPTAATPEVRAGDAEKKASDKRHEVTGGAQLVYEARTADRVPRLAWRFAVEGWQADGTPSRVYVSVDARTGKVLTREETIEAEAGQGKSLYSGTVPLETTVQGGGYGYTLTDPSRGGTYTGDAKNQSDFCFLIFCFWRAPSQVLTDTDNVWGDGTTGDRGTVAVDAQYGTSMTWDFYKTVFGRNGIAGNGKGSYNRVHYGDKYANAFWDDSCFCMTYGDGDGTNFGPLTSLDVTAHEMSHGATSSTAKLAYTGESGGLNEATSDIFAAAVEFFAKNGKDVPDYLVGEKIVLPGSGRTALRYMDKPSRDGKSLDAWSSKLASLDVHYSSGVANHFFYLLSEGSGKKTLNGVEYDSPTSNGSTLKGIGIDAATRIWYKALTAYMTSNTNYAGARTATLNAARDLFGAGSEQYAAVAATWSAVNVG
ncbi:Transglutaminase-activating metalloprotease precursor [Actinomadura rubteroloni]|uniref:Neutral metalloproteinase n=1 Tax=Actinomadura rubteroloni TaxID=1926885 RepID=A0A2P4URS0_9ACTN|nr:M4 family metallopeptidase [Actinomadura rubteroloni]POM27742.1 Transglutaminase-activating metalloprotease precursor [Actinomadura rubteroloni]